MLIPFFYDGSIFWLWKNIFRSHLTDTLDPGVIQVVSKGAFTAERAIRVDADAVLAHSWVFQTLIHV